MLRNIFLHGEKMIGPRNDPYSLSTLTFIKDENNTYELIDNSLSERSTITHNGKIIRFGVIKCLDDEFAKIIGVSCVKSVKWKYQAAIRHVMQKYNLTWKRASIMYWDIMDAEQRQLRYAM